MDTTTFLRTILPTSGVLFIAKIKRRAAQHDQTIHYPVADADEAAVKALELDEEFPQDNVYFAMASYKEVIYRTSAKSDFTYAAGRTQSNALHVKCLWQDWDVGKDNDANSYPDRNAAVAALRVYQQAVGLPAPLIVSSGYGLHTYWVFSEAVTAKEWEGIAGMQRIIMRHLQVKFDPSRDKDCASILRPVGCHNRKPDEEDRLVHVMREGAAPMPAMEYKRRLQKYITDNNLTALVSGPMGDVPEWASATGNITDMAQSYPDSFAEIAVEHCQQLQDFRSTGGTSEPLWYAHIGLMKHFKDGERFAHEWGAKYDGYDAAETDAKLSQWAVGPTTCARMKELNAEGCKGCKRTCATPLQLGYREEVAAEHIPNVDDIAVAAPIHADAVARKSQETEGMPFGWPDRFGYNRATDRITARVKDADGVWQQVGIATPLFYPIEQIRLEDGTYAFRMHMWVRGKVREFDMPTKHVADKRSLKMQLAANQVHVIDDAATANYMSNYMTNLRVAKEEIETYRQMGWHHDYKAFLIGDKLVTEAGEQRVVVSERFAENFRKLSTPKGTKDVWIDVVRTLFNKPNGEPYQFAICAAFAAPLHDLLGFSEWSGIPYAITTDKSGFGKTTVNQIANAVWGDPEVSKIANATPKSILGIASTFNCVPYLLDEVTTFLGKPQDMADTLYALSNGRGREGMDGSGRLREQWKPWKGSCAITGNRNIFAQVTENKLNPEALQMRVFEVDLDTYPRLTAMVEGHPDYIAHNAAHGLMAKTVMSESYGVIGPEYIRFIMKNIDEVRTKLRKVSSGMAKHMVGGDSSKERFYYHLITTVLVGGYYAKKLGFIDFDMNNLRDWCVKHVARMRETVKESAQAPQDNFANLMSSLSGNILITKHFENIDGRSHHGEPHIGQSMRNPIAGRYALGDEKERPKLYVTVNSVKAWCTEHGIQFNTLRREFLKEGIIRLGTKGVNRDTGAVRVRIGKGVLDVAELGSPWCIELDAHAAESILYPPAEVTPITEARAKAVVS